MKEQHKSKKNLPLFKEWILAAQDDEKAVSAILKEESFPPNPVCFFSQQIVEKILKGFLVFSGVDFPKIHRLEKLLILCKDIDPQFEQLWDEIEGLSFFYMATRYPGDYPAFSVEQAKEAFARAQKIKNFIMNKIFSQSKNQNKKEPIKETLKCSVCQTEKLKKMVFYGVEVDYCPKCLGVWFDKGELEAAKDDKDESLRWLDVDLWKDETKFKLSQGKKFCPKDIVPLYEVAYNDSKIKVDLCNLCSGVWLDRGEFKKVIEYLKKKEKDQALYNYASSLVKEGVEVFNGPQALKEELADFIALTKLLKYKFFVQHPTIVKLINQLPY
ncbi:MAG: zf-TFIIB domain-containing protein [bacterium]|nr:zf-TFIIB domain-containing protein [bacterium]